MKLIASLNPSVKSPDNKPSHSPNKTKQFGCALCLLQTTCKACSLLLGLPQLLRSRNVLLHSQPLLSLLRGAVLRQGRHALGEALRSSFQPRPRENVPPTIPSHQAFVGEELHVVPLQLSSASLKKLLCELRRASLQKLRREVPQLPSAPRAPQGAAPASPRASGKLLCCNSGATLPCAPRRPGPSPRATQRGPPSCPPNGFSRPMPWRELAFLECPDSAQGASLLISAAEPRLQKPRVQKLTGDHMLQEHHSNAYTCFRFPDARQLGSWVAGSCKPVPGDLQIATHTGKEL